MNYEIDSILNRAPCGFLSFTDDSKILMINITLLEMLGYQIDELHGKKIELILPIGSRIFYQTHFSPLLKLHNKAEDIYFALQTKQGKDIPMLINAVRQRHEETFVSNCILIPISQRIHYENEILKAKKVAETAILAQKQAELELRKLYEELRCVTQKLEKLVNIDGLTHIANRRCFDDRLEQEWLRLCREKQPISLLLFDVDYFKRYNDAYGHQLGDECLVKLAQAAQVAVSRSTDLVARYGGEEFVIILPNTDLEGAIAVAERLHKSVQSLGIAHQTSDVSSVVTISLGLAALVPSLEKSPKDLINQADQALYRAKQKGRNQTAIAM
ncbi:diguanylate cyclase domain-containing protein [Pseudanabaena minima]|uniref:diguanylate cyclase domain-containing protein n=1 Tax=Pseudanabaena minima TaxID=890415 RepID=UPI003DA9EA13